MKLIVGLGNPGNEYKETRHNVGFMAIDELAKAYNTSVTKSKFGGLYGETIINNEKIIFLKPQKYINLSGEVIIEYMNFYKININNLLIINDDLDLEVGRLKIKLQGGSGGHNGLKNIEHHLKTKQYKRIKIGISNNKMVDTKDYVLSKFSKDEKEKISRIIELIPVIFKDYLEISFENVMNKYNKN